MTIKCEKTKIAKRDMVLCLSAVEYTLFLPSYSISYIILAHKMFYSKIHSIRFAIKNPSRKTWIF